MLSLRFELDPLTGKAPTSTVNLLDGSLPLSTLRCVDEWRRLPAPPETMRLITHGLDPVLFLPLAPRRHGEWRSDDTPKLVSHLETMLRERVVEEVPRQWHGRVVENFFFAVPKANGKVRPILDCAAANSVSKLSLLRPNNASTQLLFPTTLSHFA